MQAMVIDSSGRTTDFFDIEEGSGESGLLPPGDVRLRIGSARVASQVVEGTIVDAATIELRAILRPGTHRTVAVRTADGSPLARGTSALVVDAAGEPVMLRDSFVYSADGRSEVRLVVAGLETGVYRVVIECPYGRRGEAEISVASLEPIEGDAAVVVLE